MQLNPQQIEIVNSIDGAFLVTAVPGSGKTRCITERTKNMIQRGIDPTSILAITFTNKAAKEMRERINKAVGSAAETMTISTFHAMCARILRDNAVKAGLTEGFVIADTDDQERFLKRAILSIEGEKFKPNNEYKDSIMGYLEYRRNALVSHDVAADKYGFFGKMTDVVKAYAKDMRKSNYVDFTGLLYETFRLFKTHEDVRDGYRDKFRYISVDEVQDTNVVQYEILKQLGQGHRNVMAVGDTDQSIYAFRNAEPENVMRFEKDFGAKVLKLENNYRSTPEILKHSQRLIERNTSRMATTLKTDNKPGDLPTVIGALTDDEMAQKIATDVATKIRTGFKPSEIAILYRTNFASRVLETKLKDMRIPYKIIGDLSFFDRKEIKVCISLLKLLHNEADHVSFDKVAESICRGVGPKTVQAISDYADENSISVMKAARVFHETGRTKALEDFLDAFNPTGNPSQVMLDIITATGFMKRMEEESTDRNDRCANMQDIANNLDTFIAAGGSLFKYLENLALVTEDDEETEVERVRLMTMHGSKGLEFDAVYISHLNQEIIPHKNCLMLTDPSVRGKAIQEERRLMYVAMTRARKSLSLAFYKAQVSAGGKGKECFPSQFLVETGLRIPMIPYVPQAHQRYIDRNDV